MQVCEREGGLLYSQKEPCARDSGQEECGQCISAMHRCVRRRCAGCRLLAVNLPLLLRHTKGGTTKVKTCAVAPCTAAISTRASIAPVARPSVISASTPSQNLGASSTSAGVSRAKKTKWTQTAELSPMAVAMISRLNDRARAPLLYAMRLKDTFGWRFCVMLFSAYFGALRMVAAECLPATFSLQLLSRHV